MFTAACPPTSLDPAPDSPRLGDWRRVLLFSLPALVIGFALRALLAWGMPFAYVQHDSFKFLFGDGPAWDDSSSLAFNVTCLVPWLYDLAGKSGLPSLIAIQLGQHLLGLLAVVAVAFLVRLSFQAWRWFIIPATLVVAIHPALLWYEQTVMSESVYVFCVILLALAGAIFVRCRGWLACIGLCLALYLVALARPEGWLFLGFGGFLIVITAERAQWRQSLGFLALFAVTALAARSSSTTHESGQILYSSVLHLSPETPRSFPEVAPYLHDLLSDARTAAREGPAFVSRAQRRDLATALGQFVAEHPQPGGRPAIEQVDRVAKQLGFETCGREWWALPGLAVTKFRASASDPAAGDFSKEWLGPRMWRRLNNGFDYIQRNATELYGRQFADRDEFAQFLAAHYVHHKVRWFDPWDDVWTKFYQPRFRATIYPKYKLEGLPYIYLIALAGFIAASLAPGPARPFHLAWSIMMVGLWLTIMVTANERARFRLVFEPFLFLYLLVLADTALTFARRWAQRAPAPAPAAPGKLEASTES